MNNKPKLMKSNKIKQTQQKLQIQNYIVSSSSSNTRYSNNQYHQRIINGCLYENKLIDEHEISKLYKKLHQLEAENKQLKLEIMRLTNELQKRT